VITSLVAPPPVRVVYERGSWCTNRTITAVGQHDEHRHGGSAGRSDRRGSVDGPAAIADEEHPGRKQEWKRDQGERQEAQRDQGDGGRQQERWPVPERQQGQKARSSDDGTEGDRADCSLDALLGGRASRKAQ